jgi:hypothetical protein
LDSATVICTTTNAAELVRVFRQCTSDPAANADLFAFLSQIADNQTVGEIVHTINTVLDISPRFTMVECIFVIIVVIIAGYMIYKIIKLCKKLLPPKTTNDTDNAVGPIIPPGLLSSRSTAADTNVYAAMFYGGLSSSANSQGVEDDLIPIAVEMIPVGTNVALACSGPLAFDDTAAFLDSLTNYGLPAPTFTTDADGYRTYVWPGFVPGTSCYGLNGKPVDSSPVQCQNGIVSITNLPQSRAVLQWSPDLRTWSSLMTNSFGSGQAAKIWMYTSTNRSGFYRVCPQ